LGKNGPKFWIAKLYRKTGRQITFDFKDPSIGPGRGISGKNSCAPIIALTSIFIIKVDFPPNTDILNYGNDTFLQKSQSAKKFRIFKDLNSSL
jgi:hypothetical protein